MRVRPEPCTPFVTPIQQPNDYYCGPACAAMVLRTINKAPAGGDTAVQDLVWAKVMLHSTGSSYSAPPSCSEGGVAGFATQHCFVCNACWRCWASTADALAAALNAFGAGVEVIRDNSVNRDTLLAAAVASLDHAFPAIVGMSNSTHWEVLAGYCLDSNSPPDWQSLQIGTKSVASFFVIDPMFSYQPGQLDAKTALEVVTGIGFATCAPASDSGQSLAIVKAPPSRPLNIAMKQQMILPPNAGGPLRSAAAIMTATVNEIQRGLVLNPAWDYAFQGAHAQSVAIVQRLDEKDGYFYIVDFGKDGGITGRVAVTPAIVDGLERLRLVRVQGSTIPGTFLPAFVTPAETLRPREGRPFSEADDRIVRMAATGVHPVLVWRDCAQSHNEMWPFYVITHGDRRYYQRVDGAVFAALTPTLPGH